MSITSPEGTPVPEVPNNPLVPENTGTPVPPNEPPAQPLQPSLGQQGTHGQVVPEAPEVPKEPVQPPKEGATYIETSIQHLTGELGVSTEGFDAVIENALKHSDPSLIDVNALGKELTPEQAVRVRQLATAAVQEVQANVARAVQEVHGIAGSAEQWESAVQAFNTHAAADAQGYAAYLAENGKLKEAAEYVLNYNKQGGYVNNTVQAPENGGTGSVQSGITKEQYKAEIAKIEREIGNKSFGSASVAERISQLDAQRALGRSQGR